MNYKKLIFGIVLVALAIWLLLGLVCFGNLIAFFWIFGIIVNELTLSAGLNTYLAMVIAFIPAIAILWSIALMFSLNKQKRFTGMIIGGACYMLYSGLMFALESNRYFDPATGAPTKCYAAGLTGYDEVPCNTEFHTQSGNPVIKDTEQIKAIIRSKQIANAPAPSVKRLQVSADMQFFSPTGTPLIWYYQHPDGTIEPFDHPGRHPQLNVELNPITPEIVKAYFDPHSAAEAKRIRFNASSTAPTQSTDPDNPLVKLRDHLQNVQGQLR